MTLRDLLDDEVFAFAADEAAAAAMPGAGGKTSWPVHPGEKPRKDALVTTLHTLHLYTPDVVCN